jgi:hypothetical protein
LAQERYQRRLEKIPEASVPRFLSGAAPLHAGRPYSFLEPARNAAETRTSGHF